MTHGVVYDESRPAIPGRAVSYRRSGDSYVDIDYSPLSLVYGDGGTNSSVEDVFKLDRALSSSSFLRAGTLLEAFRSGTLPDGTATGYGFGWFVRPALGMKRISHGGTEVGFRSILVRYPQQQFTVIVLGNFLEIEREKLAYQIARIYLGDTMVLPKAVRLPDSSLDGLTGAYDGCKWLKLGTENCEGAVEPGEKYEVGRDGMNLSRRYPDGNRVILLPLSNHEFFISGREDTRVVFHYTQQHLVTGMSITNYVQQTAQKSR